MALTIKITKSVYDALSADLKKEYIADGDEYNLDVTGLEDTGALKRAHDRNKVKIKDLEKKLNDTEAELDTYKSDPKARDIKALETSWNDKYKTLKDESDAQVNKFKGFLDETMVNSVANSLANEISNAPELILPHILKRLTPDYSGDKPVTKVLDKDGKASALTLEDLKKELLTNKAFAPIIVASRAKGSGGNPSPTQKTGDAGNPQEKINPMKLSAADMAARIAARKGA